MRVGQITTSAALYFKPQQGEAVPLLWFERARELILEYNLSPILFTAGGGGFLLDDGYVLEDRGRDIVGPEGYVYVARRGDLIDALQSRAIETLGLDAPRCVTGDREDWLGKVSVFSTSGRFYVGIDEDLIHDPTALLRRTYDISKGLLDIHYGIAYKMPLAQDPACYAIGHPKTSLSDVLDMIRHRREWDRRKKSPDELWGDELSGQRRHLTGLFRGAYPASILSEAHVRKADLGSHGIGRLSELDASLWLWELSDAELQAAEAMLESRRALVRGL